MSTTTPTFESRVRRLTSAILAVALAMFVLAVMLPTLGTIPDLLALRRAEARLRAAPAAKLDDTLDLTDEVGQTIAGLGNHRVIAGDIVRSADAAYLDVIRRDVLLPAFERLGAQLRREDDWLEDITVRSPGAGDTQVTLMRGEWPYLRILEHVAHATEIPPPEHLPRGPCDTSPYFGPRFGLSGRPLDTPVSPEKAAWGWWAEIGGGAPPAAAKLAGMAALVRDGLIARWIQRLQKAQRDGMYEPARRETEADFAALDEITRRIWLPLLLDPLRVDRPQ
jgi:hypothetical protein